MMVQLSMLKSLTFGRLAANQECLRKLPVAARPVPHPVNQVLPHARRQIAPILDLLHQLPKTMRPI